MRQIPTSKTTDWVRRAAEAVNALIRGQDELEAATDWSALDNYADDTAAAAGGVAIGELYRNGSVVMVRVA